MKETKLLNCPFCGGEAELFETHEHQYCIMHRNDDCVIDSEENIGNWVYDTKEEAIKAWNTRKPMERIIERLEEESVLAEKEMDRAREQNPLQYERCDSYICAIDNATEIVKEEGGIE